MHTLLGDPYSQSNAVSSRRYFRRRFDGSPEVQESERIGDDAAQRVIALESDRSLRVQKMQENLPFRLHVAAPPAKVEVELAAILTLVEEPQQAEPTGELGAKPQQPSLLDEPAQPGQIGIAAARQARRAKARMNFQEAV